MDGQQRAPLRVVHLTNSERLSGGARQAIVLAAGLQRAGHRTIFCAPPGSDVLGRAQEEGVTTEPLSFGSLWGQWRASRRLRNLVRRERADVVHSHHTKAHNVALLATFGGRFPPVVANRGVLFRPRFAAKFRTSRVAAIVTNSHAVKDVLEHAGIVGEKIHVVPNAVEVQDATRWAASLPTLREELGLTGSGPVVGSVGGGRPEKGFQVLVEAAPHVLEHYPQARFVLVGAETDHLVPRLEALGIRSAFRLPGYRRDAVAIMALFSAFVIASVDMESCPNVLLEAMGLGLPAVGADTGGIGELIVDGVTGRVVPPGDARTLAGAVLEILADPPVGARWGAAGRQRAVREFHLASKVRKTMEIYRGIQAL